MFISANYCIGKDQLTSVGGIKGMPRVHGFAIMSEHTAYLATEDSPSEVRPIKIEDELDDVVGERV